MTQTRFITFEGGEGAGKTSQIRLLKEALSNSGILVVQTREPGGSPGAEDIRQLLVSGSVERWHPLSEVLLHYAARVEHVNKTILPALKVGKWVISDRFADSTTAYQGYGHGVDLNRLNDLHTACLGDFHPDLTLILDIPVEQGLDRARQRETSAEGKGEDRYERMELDFHHRLREGFLNIARQQPERCAVVDARSDIETIAAEIREIVTARLEIAL